MRRGITGTGEGSALVMVLVLLTILSIALGAMFANAGANFATSAVVTEQEQSAKAADAGVESAIQQLRTNSALCGAPAPPSAPPTAIRVDGQPASPPPPEPDVTSRGRTVTVTCRTTAGAATSVSPWALVTTDTGANSLVSGSGGSTSISIKGPVYVAGGATFGTATQVVDAGAVGPVGARSGVYQFSNSPCPGSVSGPPMFTGLWTCTNAMPPDPKPALPCIGGVGCPLSVVRDGNPRDVNGCSIFLPGTYDKGIILRTHNYFASGVYYLQDAGPLSGGIVGGQPGVDERQVVPTTGPCGPITDKVAGIDNGTGVEIILGGTTTIEVGSYDMELYSRDPGTATPDGAAGVSVRTVPPSPPAGYKAWAGSSPALAMSNNNGRLAVHGMVYMPKASVQVFSTSTTADAALLGGLECSDLTLLPNKSGSGGVAISVQSGSQPRSVVITATARRAPADTGISSTALVAIGNDPDRTVTIRSWFTTRR